jgi:hypothetical protein
VITGFTVGAEFRLIDQFSPTLRKLLAEIRELNKALDQARASLAGISFRAARPVRHRRRSRSR